jgi:nucleoid-associated protein YgaU
MRLRKEVKIGLGVFGVFLAVLLVWLLVVPGSTPVQPGVETVSLEEDAFKQKLLEQEKAAQQANTASADANTSGGKSAAVELAGNNKPVDPFANTGAPAVSGNSDQWFSLLNTGGEPQARLIADAGRNPLRTQAPVARTADRQIAGAAPSPGRTPEPTRADPAPAGSRTYSVQPGDSIARIAEKFYGSQAYTHVLLKANASVVPERLQPGQTLVIPDAPQSRIGSNTPAGIPQVAEAVIDPTSQYKVQPGDTLSRISMKLYGKSAVWASIYELNKDVIGADPARLKVGMVLKLPQTPTQR